MSLFLNQKLNQIKQETLNEGFNGIIKIKFSKKILKYILIKIFSGMCRCWK